VRAHLPWRPSWRIVRDPAALCRAGEGVYRGAMHRSATIGPGLVLLVLAACDGPRTSAPSEEPRPDPSVVPSASEVPAQPAPPPIASTPRVAATEGQASTPRSPDRLANPRVPCVFADTTLRAILPDCAGGPEAPEAKRPADLDVKLVAPVGRVPPGASVDLELRYTNLAEAPRTLRLDRNLHVALRTVNPGGTVVDPPAGSPGFLPDPSCLPTTCPTMTTGSVVLAPRGVARVRIPWTAEKKAWPPPARVACCTVGPGPVAGAGPLPPGRYMIKATGPLLSQLTAGETVVDVGEP
jgi:hypothetical protein